MEKFGQSTKDVSEMELKVQGSCPPGVLAASELWEGQSPEGAEPCSSDKVLWIEQQHSWEESSV